MTRTRGAPACAPQLEMHMTDLDQSIRDLADPGETFEPVPTARELLARLRERGLHVEVADAGVRIWPQRLLTAEDRDAIAERLDDLVSLLHAERRPTVAPALRARAAALFTLARERLGDEQAARWLNLFGHDAGRAVFEVEGVLAARAAEGKVGDAAMAVYRHLLHEPGRVTGFGAILNRHGRRHVLEGRQDSKEYAAEVERVALLLGELEDAGLAERAGANVVALLSREMQP
jgi:hypothetical protein